MAWMIPIIADRRNRGLHKIGILISVLLLFLGLGVFFFSSLGFNKFDGFAIHSIWIIGGIIFLISIFAIVGIIATVASASSEKVKINSSKLKLNESEKLNSKDNPYIIRRPPQNHLETILHEKSKKVIPTPQEIHFCQYCGAKIEKDARFCHECGMKVKK
ncbi:MAG: zinc ribbon domain-containing protein [Candidatus Hodarchaeota archaeon]